MNVKHWYRIHRISSLISGIFFLILSVTGLILLLSDWLVALFPAAKQFLRLNARLHMNFLSGHDGLMVLCIACALIIIATISGVFLYGPFSKGQALGNIRSQETISKWKDMHRFLGIVTAAWVFFLAGTGIMIGEFSFVREAYLDSVAQAAKTTFASYQAAPTVLTENDAKAFIKSEFPDRKFYTLKKWKDEGVEGYIAYISPPTVSKNHVRQAVFLSKTYETTPLAVTKDVPGILPALGLGLELHYKHNELLVTQIMWIVFSILTTIMIWSGLYGWYLRKRGIIGRKEGDFSHSAVSSAHDTKIIWGVNFLVGFSFVWPMFYPHWELASGVALLLAVALILWAYARHKK